jgi:hypothetical protein
MAASAQKRKSTLPLIIFLLILLILGIFLLLPSYNVQVNTSTQSTTQNQCPQVGQNFDAQQEAFTLAQSAVQYRRAQPLPVNYGLGSFIICLTDGTFKREQSIIFKGRSSNSYPGNDTHSEQSAYGWLQNRLVALSIDPDTISAIYTFIFSQVRVCSFCKKDMVYWQRTLREKARTNNLFLSVWDIGFQQGFNPKLYPAGLKSTITIAGIENVHINFAA